MTYTVLTTVGEIEYNGVENFQELWDTVSQGQNESFAIINVYDDQGNLVDLTKW